LPRHEENAILSLSVDATLLYQVSPWDARVLVGEVVCLVLVARRASSRWWRCVINDDHARNHPRPAYDVTLRWLRLGAGFTVGSSSRQKHAQLAHRQ
jgi:hypothetical protein